jgi:membrane protease YdiL (CAAX protease family)
MGEGEELIIDRSIIIKLTLIQALIFLVVALVYAVYRGDVGSIGIITDRISVAIFYGFLLFVVVLPFLYLPRRMGIRNQLEEAIALNLGRRDILALNLAVSCSEELFFRGFLLGIIGVIPSSIIFGAMHYIGYSSKLEVAYALSVGLLLGYLYKLYLPNILFPITFHFLANAFTLLMTRRWATLGK